MDGRDIGTTILPNAEEKSNLTASAEHQSQKKKHWNMNRREKPSTWTRSAKISSNVTNAT